MKQLVLSLFASLTVLCAQAQVRGATVAHAQSEKQQPADQLEKEISIYPNPSNGVFTISLANLESKTAELRIINVIGNEILRETITRNDGQFSKEIDLNKFAKGLYYVKLEADNYSAIKRVVIK
ncbi:T9SS type A sorting domain-containing protein [Pontibacter vulgaris]|uniref:T9SS type A sorting domain-containing protein n=1 Tax=Pontibacter vulgaris TaxID=2905679 RepID=UPI001FA75E4B|nr:T9SS type A sorting domain-containing protein [Pontibacter vulgaris]